GTASRPLPATSMSRWRTSEASAASSALTAAGASLPSTGDAASTQRSSMLRPDTSMPRKTSLSDIERPIRWRCSPSRKPSHPSAPATSGRRPSALLSNDSAHMCTGYGRVVTRRWTHRPCSSPSCDAIWRISTSRWESLRKLHACAASRYHAMTCVEVRVMWPSIDRNAMVGRYLGSPASPASARRARRLGGGFSRFLSRGTGPPLRPFATALRARLRRPCGPDRDVLGPHRTPGHRRAPTRATQLVPEQGDDLAERTFVIDALAEEARDQNGDDQRPGDREEVEPDPDPALQEHDHDHYQKAEPVAHISSAPGERGARRTEPHRVDPVHLVIGAHEHARHPVMRRARKLPTSGPLPDTAMPSATRPTRSPTLRRATPALSPRPPIHSRITAMPSSTRGTTLSWIHRCRPPVETPWA